jgi:hypothetical protein
MTRHILLAIALIGATLAPAAATLDRRVSTVLTPELVTKTLEGIGFMPGATAMLGGENYKLERVIVKRGAGPNDFVVSFTAVPVVP